MAVQNALLTILPQGVWLLRGFLTRAEQEAIRDELRDVARQAPFFVPTMPYDGTPFKVSITNAGEFGWVADREHGFRYSKRHPDGQAWPPIPPRVLDASARAARAAGFMNYRPNVCLLNLYAPGTGSLGRHRDDTRGEDRNAPIVTLSLGASCEVGVGGLDAKDDYTYVDFNSGDVMVLGGVGRLIYHEIRNVTAGSDLLAKGGRISATLRRAMFESRGTKTRG